MFEAIESVVIKKIDENNGLFLGTCHKDEYLHRHLSRFIKKLSKKQNIVIFAEIKAEAFSCYLPAFNLFSEDKKTDFDYIYGFLKDLNGQTASNEFLAFLLTLYFSDIKISCFDYIPTTEQERQDNERAINILYGRQNNITVNDLRWASAQRTSGDERIAEMIKQDLQQKYPEKKYIIIGGTSHVKISKALKISAINVIPHQHYLNLLLGSDISIIQNLQSNSVDTYSYEENSLKQVNWDNKSQEAKIYSQYGIYSPNPDQYMNPEFYKNKGNEFFKRENYEPALRCYDKAIELNRNYKEAWLNRARALYKLGKKQEALKSAQEAVNIDPDYGNAKSVLKEIKADLDKEQSELKNIARH